MLNEIYDKLAAEWQMTSEEVEGPSFKRQAASLTSRKLYGIG